MTRLSDGNKAGHSRFGEVGHTVAVHAADAGRKIGGELGELAPKARTAAMDATHTAAHAAAEWSGPVRDGAASRGSAALSGLLGEVTPAQIERVTGRASRHVGETHGRFVRVLAVGGGIAALWLLWRNRTGAKSDFRLEEVIEPDPVARQDESSMP